jgi:hypothetical protein
MATRTSRLGFGHAAIPDFFRPPPSEADDPAPARPALGSDIRDHIGTELRALYATLAREPVPERFVALLRQLGPTGGEDPS